MIKTQTQAVEACGTARLTGYKVVNVYFKLGYNLTVGHDLNVVSCRKHFLKHDLEERKYQRASHGVRISIVHRKLFHTYACDRPKEMPA